MSAINIGCGGQKLPSDVLEKIHQHNNKNVLDNLNDDNGTLTYKGIVLGQNGKSAYEIWLEEGNTGTIDDFLQSLVGPQGNTGNDGNSIELRKTDTSIEWRQVPHKIMTADFNAKKTMMTAKANATIDKIVINSYPEKARYAQIKTVTIFGANANGEDLINENPSINTAPEGVTFPEFGGFDPVTSGPVDLKINPEIVGNASIKTIIDTCLPRLSKVNPEVTKINKITFWIYFLNENKEELKFVEACCHIIQNTAETISEDSEWKELFPLITVDSHVHSNKVDVLDKLSVVDGKLNFNNQPIQGESIPVDLSNYYTKVETYNKTEVDEKIANISIEDLEQLKKDYLDLLDKYTNLNERLTQLENPTR